MENGVHLFGGGGKRYTFHPFIATQLKISKIKKGKILT
jgi:hypothetical protein